MLSGLPSMRGPSPLLAARAAAPMGNVAVSPSHLVARASADPVGTSRRRHHHGRIRLRRTLLRTQAEHRHEGFLWDLDVANALHATLPLGLFLQQLPFARDVAAVALREHVLAHGPDRLTGDHFVADRG